jgi:hypothetical protein
MSHAIRSIVALVAIVIVPRNIRNELVELLYLGWPINYSSLWAWKWMKSEALCRMSIAWQCQSRRNVEGGCWPFVRCAGMWPAFADPGSTPSTVIGQNPTVEPNREVHRHYPAIVVYRHSSAIAVNRHSPAIAVDLRLYPGPPIITQMAAQPHTINHNQRVRL